LTTRSCSRDRRTVPRCWGMCWYGSGKTLDLQGGWSPTRGAFSSCSESENEGRPCSERPSWYRAWYRLGAEKEALGISGLAGRRAQGKQALREPSEGPPSLPPPLGVDRQADQAGPGTLSERFMGSQRQDDCLHRTKVQSTGRRRGPVLGGQDRSRAATSSTSPIRGLVPEARPGDVPMHNSPIDALLPRQ
jgi:hypothetical protein